ncbi:hypothetical protein DYB32_008743 [Aphanomyces invadans]|uniref:Uncharacterized protein n=1 Tax=Aphanomyces invadans TaxID=157072 RepID=A0A3R7A3W6_9STRA|nr:hypothetical protein DYB32_008743 [Aphanomyces invadans]
MYSTGGDAHCKSTLCHQGFGAVAGASEVTGSCVKCEPGYYSLGQKSPCLPTACKPGYASDVHGNHLAEAMCTLCPQGYYSASSYVQALLDLDGYAVAYFNQTLVDAVVAGATTYIGVPVEVVERTSSSASTWEALHSGSCQIRLAFVATNATTIPLYRNLSDVLTTAAFTTALQAQGLGQLKAVQVQQLTAIKDGEALDQTALVPATSANNRTNSLVLVGIVTAVVAVVVVAAFALRLAKFNQTHDADDGLVGAMNRPRKEVFSRSKSKHHTSAPATIPQRPYV